MQQRRVREEERPFAVYLVAHICAVFIDAPLEVLRKRCGDPREEVRAAANFRCPREEERDRYDAVSHPKVRE